jgi:hypothetical protein
MEDKITMVITSCNRYELLKRTIYSFLEFNTHPVDKYIIVDDSGLINFHKQIQEEFGAIFQVIGNTKRIGQIRSIDYAYSLVKTKYIFHCEDDWEFYHCGFIEPSLELLKLDPKILQVWLRERNDTNGHPVLPQKYLHNGISYQFMAYGYVGYHGFSFNPGLRRLSDYELIKPYSSVPYDNTMPFKGSRFYAPEMEISEFYKNLGYKAAILENGFVKHIGDNHRVGWD